MIISFLYVLTLIVAFPTPASRLKHHFRGELTEAPITYLTDYVEVPLSWSNFTYGAEKFSVRYLSNTSFVESDSDAPIFLYTGNEAPIE